MSLNLKTSFFSLLTPIELEQTLQNIQLNSNTLHKLKINNTSGYDLTFEIDSYLEQIEIQNKHEINFLKQFVNKQINEQLKLKVKIDDTQCITIQLDNNINTPLQEIIEYLCKIGVSKTNDFFLSPIDSNELLIPNVKIVKLILEQPHKYSCLKLCNKILMTTDNGYINTKHLSIDSINKTYLEKESNEITYNKFNTARDNYDLLGEKLDTKKLIDNNRRGNNNVSNQKINNYEIKNHKENINIKSNDLKSDYYKYRQTLNHKSKSHSNLTSIDRNLPNDSNFNSDIDNVNPLQSSNIGNNKNEYNTTILKTNSYITFNNNISEKYRTENYKDDNKDEVQRYIKKDYDIYSKPNLNNKKELLNNINDESEYRGKPSKKIEISINNNNKQQLSSEQRNCCQSERNIHPEYNNDLYKKYEKYSSNNNIDNPNKKYEVNSNYIRYHQNEANSSSISKTNNNVSAYELRNKVNLMRNQLNVYSSLESNNNENHQRERTISHNTNNHNDDNNFSNYKVFKKENDETIDNINNDLSTIEPTLNKHSLNINTNI